MPGNPNTPSRDLNALAVAAADAMLASDQASRSLGMRLLEVRPGYARLSMRVEERMLNGHRICHGGLIFALADSAFAFACNSHNRITVAAGAAIDFLAPARLGDELTAVAEERTRSKRTGLYDINVYKQTGEAIAMFRGRSHELGGPIVEPPST
jgi:acyl-CoA thioesterase